MVELRTRTHLRSPLHSIRAIKDGSIKIVVNKDARGKPKLKFRQLVDIYNQDNTKEDDESIPIVVRDFDNVSTVDFTLTLEKIRKQCREKKRKLRNRGDTETVSQVKVKQESLTLETEGEGCDLEEPLSNWDTKFSKRRKKKQERKTKCGSTSSPSAKQVDLPVFCDVKPEAAWDDSYSLSEAMEFVHTDPLLECNKEVESTTSAELVKEIMHELVLYRSPETNYSGMVAIEEPVTTVEDTFEDAPEEFNDARKPQCCLDDNTNLENQAIVLYSRMSREEIELEVPQSSDSEALGLPVFCDVKPEAWDDSYLVSEAMECNKAAESYTNAELVEVVMHDLSKETRLVLYRSPEPNSSGMVAIEDPVATNPAEVTFEDATKARGCLAGSVYREEIEETTHELSKETRLVLYRSPELQSSRMLAVEESVTINPVEDAFEDASEEFNDEGKAQGCLIDNIDLEDQAIVLYSSLSGEEIEMEVPQSSDSDTSSESKEAKEDEQGNDSKPKIEAPEVLATATSDFVVENTEIAMEAEDIVVKDELPEAIDIMQLTNCCNSLANLHLVPDDSTIPLEEDRLQQLSASSGHVDGLEDHKTPQLYKEPDEVTTSAATETIEQQKLHNQPEKLLSGRKALSPTSQAKLRKAMEHPDSPERKCKKSKGRLYFSSQNSHRILKAQGLDNIDRVELISNQSINNTQQKQYQRATRKFPRRDTRAAKRQPFSTGCTSIQGCTQKAITFSQGQMHDFQFVATRLTKELKSMREIAKRCLLAESNTSNMPDSNTDEVKTLIRNAEKTEKSSEKWLSIIERDCNRFCKLMGLVNEDAPATTENIVQKEKKIKFADDAGGDLCHVKVFEIDLDSES